ncbi:E7 [Canine papillomavirus 21]|uniref:E7 n=1 Tax=Canine papillomavirus 21 TaxID=2304619 RepID=UPI000E3604A9|nr:E7 [Canine papillomavirus 21]AXQ03948.1 E7 [Canine papillomavirus 21]
MIGNKPTIADVELELSDLVLPVDLLSGESLDAEEEEPLQPYRVVTNCGRCSCTLSLCVAVGERAQLLRFQQLFIDGLTFVCVTCAKGQRHGRR